MSHKAFQQDGGTEGPLAVERVTERHLGQLGVCRAKSTHVDVHTHIQMEQCQFETENRSVGQRATRKAVCLLSHCEQLQLLCAIKTSVLGLLDIIFPPRYTKHF